jgi:hypothetical protein
MFFTSNVLLDSIIKYFEFHHQIVQFRIIKACKTVAIKTRDQKTKGFVKLDFKTVIILLIVDNV